MDDALGMGARDAFEDRLDECAGLFDRERSLFVEHLAQGLPLDVFKDQVGQPFEFADVVDRDDVGVGQAACYARLQRCLAGPRCALSSGVCSTLIATRRPRFGSLARYTDPWEPRPMRRTSS